MLIDTLKKKKVRPLTRKNFVRELRLGGTQGLHRRGQTVLHLLSNTQTSGIVLNRDYLHLSRALMAAVGSFSSLYENAPSGCCCRTSPAASCACRCATNPRAHLRRADHVARRAARFLPLPDALRSRWLPKRPCKQVRRSSLLACARRRPHPYRRRSSRRH